MYDNTWAVSLTVLKHKLGKVTVSTEQMAGLLFSKRQRNKPHEIQDYKDYKYCNITLAEHTNSVQLDNTNSSVIHPSDFDGLRRQHD